MAKEVRTTNRGARQCVANRVAFSNSNKQLYGGWNASVSTKYDDGPVYVVYSYGSHFPLYAYHEGLWYGNSDKYSVTTSRHRTYAHPPVPTQDIHWKDTRDMRTLAEGGFGALVHKQLGGE